MKQSFKALSEAKHSLHKLSRLSSHRSFYAPPNPSPHEDLQSQVLVERKVSSRTAILNRPCALNALNAPMLSRLQKLYESWEENNDIGFVMMKGNGRAFCAGGDVVTLYRFINEGKVDACKKLFGTAYKFIYLIGRYMKPHVAFMDGITMGGGAGISITGTFRVATEKTAPGLKTTLGKLPVACCTVTKQPSDSTVFGTPETQIGLHTDGGASFYLSRLPGSLGEYLALTGDKLNGIEMIACGLATHYAPHARLAWIEERLSKLNTDDPSIIKSALDKYCDHVYPEANSVLHRMETINKCFGRDTVEEIVDALEDEATKSSDEWCASALKKLKEASPLSLKLSLRSIREGRFESLDQCLIREYRMSIRGISKEVSDDFCEGVRARLVDKDYAPKWDPPTLDQVSKDMVDYYFAPFSESEPELELPQAKLESINELEPETKLPTASQEPFIWKNYVGACKPVGVWGAPQGATWHLTSPPINHG